MKATFLALLLGIFTYAMAELDPPMSWDSALPLQAAVADLAGIGRVLSRSATNAIVQVDTVWYGSETNTINITCRVQFPTNNTPVVFFASEYQSFLDLEPSESRYTYIFDMSYHRSRHEPDGLFLLNGERSWFPVTPESEQMVTWCSNLVYTSQVSVNTNAFYELIRDGYRQNPESSRIRRDSLYNLHAHRLLYDYQLHATNMERYKPCRKSAGLGEQFISAENKNLATRISL
jgi:hypothetical protein